VLEILKSTMRTRDYVMKGETDGKSLTDAMHDGSVDGMQTFDDELEKALEPARDLEGDGASRTRPTRRTSPCASTTSRRAPQQARSRATKT
jgi:twitching motility protein PilT